MVYLFDESGCEEFGDLLAYGPTPLIIKVEYLSNKSGYQEFDDFFAYGPVPFIVETTQALLGRL